MGESKTASERWFGRLADRDGMRGKAVQPRGVVQIESALRDHVRTNHRDRTVRFTLPEHVLRLAQAQYERHYRGQDYERMQERGGLGLLEVVGLLADYVERLGGTPTKPRP